MSEFVQCSCCLRKYSDLISLETKQAINCASSIFIEKEQTKVMSHYGSDHDWSLFDVSEKSCLVGKVGEICDNCIDKLILNNELINESNYM